MTENERITALEKQVAALINRAVYTDSDIMRASGQAANDSRFNQFLINSLLNCIPYICAVDVPFLEGDTVSTITVTPTLIETKETDKMTLINLETGTLTDLVCRTNTSVGATSFDVDSFTATELIGSGSLIIFKVARVDNRLDIWQ